MILFNMTGGAYRIDIIFVDGGEVENQDESDNDIDSEGEYVGNNEEDNGDDEILLKLRSFLKCATLSRMSDRISWDFSLKPIHFLGCHF